VVSTVDKDVGFIRRVTPAVLVALAGGALLYALPSPTGLESTDEVPVANPNPTPISSPGPKATSANPSASKAAPATRTIRGDAIQFQFGVAQVDVVLTGSMITDIVLVQAPGGRFQPYTDRAVPTMKQRIIAAQSTSVAAASGATYTSRGYAQSVQSALDKA
jgi:uncharacterized protein with FMN-binding domain